MALITSRTSLNQGTVTAVSDAAFTGSAAANTIIGGAATLPAIATGEFFEIRDHSVAGNNGLYVATGSPTTSSISCTKVFGANPTNQTLEAINVLGTTGAGTEKSVFFDAQGLGTAILEQGNVDAFGVTGQAIYSFTMQEWKEDAFLIANAPFPMLTIDSDAGKYIIGQDISGNNSGWNWLDNTGNSIRTRKLLRNAGWDEVNASGVTIAREVGVVTLGTFEDAVNDNAYFQFGNDTIVDDTVNFTFNGPVNEAVRFFELIGDLTGDTPAFATTTTFTRATGSFITDGFKVGGQITISGSTSNDGTYVLSAVSALSLTITTTWTAEAISTTQIAVNNDNAMTLRLRVRDADPKGKTFAQANLTSAGKSVLGNFVFSFPLANGADQKIDVTDVGIDANSDGTADVAPYTGMGIEYFAAPQARTDLVGGSANFGIIVTGNDGTAQQVHEFLAWSLRSTGGFGTGDIDSGAEVAIGRAMDGLSGFVGDTGHFGSSDGGLNFPSNPDGGGTGVYIDGLNALSKNSVIFYDNTNAPLTFPETIAVTLDFNQIAIDEAALEYDLFYDRTTRAAMTDLVMTTVAGGTFTSAGTQLPNNTGTVVGSYVRVSGLTGLDAPMNGVYQIVTETTPGASWVVTRYDGATIVAVTAATASVDENCVNTPDAIHVHTNVRTAEVSATPAGTAVLTFTAPDTITDSANTLGVFAAGMFIQIENSTGNDGIYVVDTAIAGTLTLIEQTIITEAVGVDTDVSITEIVSGVDPAVDLVFSYDFDNNTQGGRTVSTTTVVKAKAIGAAAAQYIESSVASIVSGTPLTIPVAPATERNYV